MDDPIFKRDLKPAMITDGHMCTSNPLVTDYTDFTNVTNARHDRASNVSPLQMFECCDAGYVHHSKKHNTGYCRLLLPETSERSFELVVNTENFTALKPHLVACKLKALSVGISQEFAVMEYSRHGHDVRDISNNIPTNIFDLADLLYRSVRSCCKDTDVVKCCAASFCEAQKVECLMCRRSRSSSAPSMPKELKLAWAAWIHCAAVRYSTVIKNSKNIRSRSKTIKVDAIRQNVSSDAFLSFAPLTDIDSATRTNPTVIALSLSADSRHNATPEECASTEFRRNIVKFQWRILANGIEVQPLYRAIDKTLRTAKRGTQLPVNFGFISVHSTANKIRPVAAESLKSHPHNVVSVDVGFCNADVTHENFFAAFQDEVLHDVWPSQYLRFAAAFRCHAPPFGVTTAVGFSKQVSKDAQAVPMFKYGSLFVQMVATETDAISKAIEYGKERIKYFAAHDKVRWREIYRQEKINDCHRCLEELKLCRFLHSNPIVRQTIEKIWHSAIYGRHASDLFERSYRISSSEHFILDREALIQALLAYFTVFSSDHPSCDSGTAACDISSIQREAQKVHIAQTLLQYAVLDRGRCFYTTLTASGSRNMFTLVANSTTLNSEIDILYKLMQLVLESPVRQNQTVRLREQHDASSNVNKQVEIEFDDCDML